MTAFGIYREPGHQAERRREEVARVYAIGYSPRPKRVATVEAETGRDALETFRDETYLERGHAQYAGSRFEWRGTAGRKWRADDGARAKGRDWSLVVTLANGANVHDVRFLAWRQA